MNPWPRGRPYWLTPSIPTPTHSSIHSPPTLPTHSSSPRSTFRRISADTANFTVFANGLMNEINNLVASVMEKLPEIRSVQQQQKGQSVTK